MKIALAIVLLAISGCANFQGMSADQIKAATSDKNASALCARVVGVWGTATTVIANLDQRVIDTGGMTVTSSNGDCAVSMNNIKPTPAPKVVAPASTADPAKVPQ